MNYREKGHPREVAPRDIDRIFDAEDSTDDGWGPFIWPFRAADHFRWLARAEARWQWDAENRLPRPREEHPQSFTEEISGVSIGETWVSEGPEKAAHSQVVNRVPTGETEIRRAA